MGAPGAQGAPLTQTAAQQSALDRLRQSPHSAGVHDRHLLRFLAARKGRPEAAAEMLARRRLWRQTNFPLGMHPGSVPMSTIHAVLAQQRFVMMPKRNRDERKVLYVSLREYSKGRYQVMDHLVALLYLFEQTLPDIADDPGPRGALTCVLNCDGVNRPPTALLQRITASLGSWYPGLLHKIVIYPVGPVREQVIRDILPFVDVGGITDQAEVAFVSTPDELAREAGLARPVVVTDAAAAAEGGDAPPPQEDEGDLLQLSDFPKSLRVDLSRPLRRSTVQLPEGQLPAPPPPGWGREQPHALRKKGQWKHRAETGEFVVYTPWYPEGVVQHELTLEEEMVEFARFMLLTEVERKHILRSGLRASLQGVVAQVWPHATVKAVGALAMACITAGRPVQFAVEGCGDLRADGVPAHLLELLTQAGFHVNAPRELDDIAAGVFVHVSTGGGSHCDLSFHSGDSLARQSVPVFKRMLQEFPAARPAFVVLERLLDQGNCLGWGEGKLNAKCLMLMVLHVCRVLDSEQRAARTLNPEHVLRRSLHYYGQEFDFANRAVDATATGPVPKAQAAQLVIVDPVTPEHNCAASCFRLAQVRLQLQYCNAALAKSAVQQRGPRGRTPLSAVVSYDPLWERRRELSAGMSLVRSPGGSERGGPERGSGKKADDGAARPLLLAMSSDDEPSPRCHRDGGSKQSCRAP